MAATCRRFLVSGRVQGVFYRASSCDAARALGLNGWVRNLADGRVELMACGEPAQLDALAAWLWEGPPHAKVERVTAHDEPAASFDGFDVRY
jgi:acylphosphatase